MSAIHPSDETLSLYTAAKLDAEAVASVERHLLACAECRGTVTVGMAVRSEKKPNARRIWVPAGAAAAAAALALFVASTRSDPMRELGAVDAAPGYVGLPVRADVHPGDSSFNSGMRHYQSHRFREAINDLREARRLGADSAATSFFIGVSLLMMNQPEEAGQELKAVARGESLYAGEAGYYRAKAFIRLGQADSAIAMLQAAASIENHKKTESADLMEAIGRMRQTR